MLQTEMQIRYLNEMSFISVLIKTAILIKFEMTPNPQITGNGNNGKTSVTNKSDMSVEYYFQNFFRLKKN